MASNTLAQIESKAAVTTTIRFPEELLKRAKKAAVDFNTTLQQMTREGLELRLRQLDGTANMATASMTGNTNAVNTHAAARGGSRVKGGG